MKTIDFRLENQKMTSELYLHSIYLLDDRRLKIILLKSDSSTLSMFSPQKNESTKNYAMYLIISDNRVTKDTPFEIVTISNVDFSLENEALFNGVPIEIREQQMLDGKCHQQQIWLQRINFIRDEFVCIEEIPVLHCLNR